VREPTKLPNDPNFQIEGKKHKLGTLRHDCFIKNFLTERHEIMKTGRKKISIPPPHFHVFIFSCFPVEK